MRKCFVARSCLNSPVQGGLLKGGSLEAVSVLAPRLFAPLSSWASSSRQCRSYAVTVPPSEKFARAKRIETFGETVWSEFTPLAQKYQAVQLGQGFPDFPAPDFVLAAAQTAIHNNLNQYTRMQGHPRLVKALANTYSPLFGRELDPMNDILVTVGATEGIFAVISALVNPGEEVIMLEPFYDAYPTDTILNEGVPVYVPLRPPKVPKGTITSANDWKLDFDELESKITPKSKILIFNNPTNIPGKVWTREEMEEVARLAKKHNLIVLSDEVYEWMTYDDATHIRMASLPGMWERTITLGSAGKSFSVTGWKVGWAIAPPHFTTALGTIHQFDCFTHGTPLQEAIAVAFEQAEEKNYFPDLKQMYWRKRDKLVATLRDCGLAPVVPKGSYFVMADTSSIPSSVFMGKGKAEPGIGGDGPKEETRSYQFCRWLTRELGVGAIPPSAFFSKENAHIAENFVRFTFCKRDEVLDAAATKLHKLRDLSAQ